MKSSIANTDVSLSEIPQARARRNQFIEDTRRFQEAARDIRRRKSPWKVTCGDGPLPPAWEFSRDKEGKILVASQIRRMPNRMDTDPKFYAKRFRCLFQGDACLVGGQHVENGCEIECFAHCAFQIHGTRGKIVEEFLA